MSVILSHETLNIETTTSTYSSFLRRFCWGDSEKKPCRLAVERGLSGSAQKLLNCGTGPFKGGRLIAG